jgi:hypothetical protein
VLMCGVPGFDASSHVDDLATELNKQITSIAIGTIVVLSILFLGYVFYEQLMLKRKKCSSIVISII